MVDLRLGDVDVVDGGASTSFSTSRSSDSPSASLRISSSSISASTVSFRNLNQLGRRLHSETLL